ncbi:BEN domain-containing protein 2 isoform X1 [Arapaima gigas]
MSANDQSLVRIKVEEEYDQVLAVDQHTPVISEELHVVSSKHHPGTPDLPKPYSLQMVYAEELLVDPVGPPSVADVLQAGQEPEEQSYSPGAKRIQGSTSLLGSMSSEAEEEHHTEVSSGMEIEYDSQPQVEAIGSTEDLYIDHQRTLGEILTYCQVMYEAIQNLDQKFESLQAKVTGVQTQFGPNLFQQKAQLLSGSGAPAQQLRTDGTSMADSGLPMPLLIRVGSPPPSLQTEGKKPPTLSPAPGVPSPPRLAPQGPPRQTTATASLSAPSLPASKTTSETPKKASLLVKGGTCKAARRCVSKGRKGMQKTVWLGDPKRKVRVACSVLKKAAASASPSSAVRLLLRNLFPVETLTSSNIMGDSVRGLKKLDPNKISAMREWVAKKFPTFDLKESGRDWKTCVSIMNSTARYLRFEAKKHKHKGQCSGSNEPMPLREAESHVSKATAEIDVELSDSEGDGPSTSRKTPTSVPQQKPAEKSCKPRLTENKSIKDDIFEYLGPPSRQVKVPQSAMSTARQRTRPELVARFLIKYLFPEHVLVKSNVYGNREHGIQALDQNKISALREYLKDRFPWMLLEEKGQDWKVCVGAINSTIRKFRHDLKKGKTRRKAR